MDLQLITPSTDLALNGQEELFSQAYVNLDPVEAWNEAGYRPRKTEALTRIAAQKLARTQKIKSRIKYYELRLGQKLEEMGVNAAANLQAIINVSVQDLLDPVTGEAIPIHQLPKTVGKAISEYKTIETEFGIVTTVKFHNKLPAIRLAFAHKGMSEPSAQSKAPRVVLELGRDVTVNKIINGTDT